ncbi:unnamed protein product [Adineta steineri]|uniref:Uncharacterized protein n=1 Tax=Adineta steineri TaxID=433720 RepID=A0A815S0U6_9BILA|nr:unnamed protein product [Adineta steineri]
MERYEQFLKEPEETVGENMTFYNCSSSWYGATCQYTFDSYDEDFNTVVQETFRQKKGKHQDVLDITNGTCYPFLDCRRVSYSSFCLDWREVCDGRIDCIGDDAGNNVGIDEEGCFEVLDLTECKENDEFRCRNGQCIPDEFLWEKSIDFDCLDGSDETLTGWTHSDCYSDPSFRCEQKTCQRLRGTFACGDGECNLGFSPCANGRDMALYRAMLAREATPGISDSCWSTIICAMRWYFLNFPIFDSVRCERICGKVLYGESHPTCDELMKQHCPDQFQFPATPVIQGHIILIQTNTRVNKGGAWLPLYFCFREDLCPNHNIPIFHRINGSICFNHLKNDAYRLMDYVADCYNDDDEYPIFEHSCQLDQAHRFKCTSEIEKCISPFGVHDTIRDCYNNEDELHGADHRLRSLSADEEKLINFPTLCDGYEDIVYSSNETDETDCELWPCDNQYTHCNIYHNCANGLDEADCPLLSTCPSMQVPCIDPHTKLLGCLPFNRTNDNNIDCLGASDERHICRTPPYEDLTHDRFSFVRYRCWNDTSVVACMTVDYVCDGTPDCILTTKMERLTFSIVNVILSGWATTAISQNLLVAVQRTHVVWVCWIILRFAFVL